MEAIKYYVKGAFVGVAETPEVLEQQEELIADMTAKVADLVADGRSEDEALGMAIASMGDLSGLVKEFATEEPAQAAPVVPAVPEPVMVDVEIAKLRLHTVLLCAGGAVAVLFVLTVLGALGGIGGSVVIADLLLTLVALAWIGVELFRFHRNADEIATVDSARGSMKRPLLQWVAVCAVAFVLNLALDSDGFWAWAAWIGAAAWPATLWVRHKLIERGMFLHPKVEAEPALDGAVAAAGACG